MLFCCRSCERSLCRNCVDVDSTVVLGDLKEFKLLGCPELEHASRTARILEHLSGYDNYDSNGRMEAETLYFRKNV